VLPLRTLQSALKDVFQTAYWRLATELIILTDLLYKCFRVESVTNNVWLEFSILGHCALSLSEVLNVLGCCSVHIYEELSYIDA
jgi:hypothetical protein